MLKTKLGIFKKKFPIRPVSRHFITLGDWRDAEIPFFFNSKQQIKLPKDRSEALKNNLEEIKTGIYTFFCRQKLDLGDTYDWITNPINNHKYSIEKHFSQIRDLDETAGDIKFVWEKARFSFLYNIIRYDFNFEEDQSQFVFSQIEDFIHKNPINLGPNYKCSQEISLRILNWTFALYYYKDSSHLTDELFDKIQNSIYWQLHHVYNNINFSRITVRNNHAITETLMLYLSNLLFPFIPETKKWSRKGKKYFEQEIAYQIYSDGTYLQYSMNYHRVVVQLLTWAIQLAKLNGDSFKNIVYENAQKSINFLDACLNIENGHLPNYGSNDGALFFKLTDDDYRDYRSQIDDLRSVLSNKVSYNTNSHFWYGIQNPQKIKIDTKGINVFDHGGYYIINEKESKTFIKCGSYKDRPAQADNLHLDIWVNGINFLRDTGSYKYNTSEELLHYFLGAEGHNTISIDGKNQMLKGMRFIWFNWIKKSNAVLKENKNKYVFEGEIQGFREISNALKYKRSLEKSINELEWNVTDEVNIKGRELTQYWHINPKYKDSISIKTKDESGRSLDPIFEEKWYSSYYGVKEKSLRISFKSKSSKLYTSIKIKN